MFRSVVLLVIFLSCRQCLGAKGHRKGVKMTLERINVYDINDNLLQISARVDKVSRTDFAMSVNFTILQDLPTLNLRLDVFALYSNEYRPMPLTISRNMCELFNVEFKWIEKEITKFSRTPTKCPITKGDWYIKNFIPDTSKLPFESPWDNVKLRIRYSELATNKTLCCVDVYLHKNK